MFFFFYFNKSYRYFIKISGIFFEIWANILHYLSLQGSLVVADNCVILLCDYRYLLDMFIYFLNGHFNFEDGFTSLALLEGQFSFQLVHDDFAAG